MIYENNNDWEEYIELTNREPSAEELKDWEEFLAKEKRALKEYELEEMERHEMERAEALDKLFYNEDGEDIFYKRIKGTVIP